MDRDTTSRATTDTTRPPRDEARGRASLDRSRFNQAPFCYAAAVRGVLSRRFIARRKFAHARSCPDDHDSYATSRQAPLPKNMAKTRPVVAVTGMGVYLNGMGRVDDFMKKSRPGYPPGSFC